VIGSFIFFSMVFFAVVGAITILTRTTPLETEFPLWGILLILCSLAVFIPLAFTAAGLFFFKKLGKPIITIMAAADAVADGDLSVRVPEDGTRELQQLANSFNSMAEQLEVNDKQRKQLTADIAHELRSPLHVIRGNLEGILDGVYTADREHLENTLLETSKLTRLIEDLQTLSLGDNKQLELNFETLDLTDIINDTKTSFTPAARSRDIELCTSIDSNPGGFPFVGDALRLNQALSNLVSNSLRHTPAGGMVNIGLHLEGRHYVLSVEDTGEGIPKADQAFVFERFWRGDRARTRSSLSGSGLGLPISKQIVEALGGRIAFTSKPGRGTRFFIYLENPYPAEPSGRRG
jgi:two-component system OmpR family sensor kinase/two-component system sensor histidine kinase BaeS